ncbi:hypothetical protein GCM10012275_19490 [Longimycelium tulufanense]|uniref:Prolyl 4-hydroxylase alpha subunit domain-containing protein n=1 Tax=Longimycelium tulufanense TaxID=907463 RepID=A0A8J3FTD7_9PSEU|nr:2OG-Fe(II) oxygenase [Longimycelium tulufanense]GGM48670.1 hypothetical protein GCM10012275_19490 [Longimycelium tulufanense]
MGQTMSGTAALEIDWDAFRRSSLAEHPYRWGLLRGMFPARLLPVLEVEFPGEGFVVTQRRSGGDAGQKGYRSANLSLVAGGHPVRENIDLLSSLWRQLVDALCSPEYRSAITTLSGRDVSECALELRAVRYGPGSWIDPHTDRADKIVTQTWYFNDNWRPEWRGQLAVLSSPDKADVHTEVAPALGESVVLCPSEHSWHMVHPVAESAAGDRRTLLAHFVAPR